VEEAELGERIMRLDPRRVALLDVGAGGPVTSAARSMPMFCASKVSLGATGIRLAIGFKDRLVRKRDRAPYRGCELPIVLCPNGQRCTIPVMSSRPLHRAVADRPGQDLRRGHRRRRPGGSAAAVYAGSEGLSVLTLDCRASAVKPASARIGRLSDGH
jgi:thioredoxin reductase (NADPH)